MNARADQQRLESRIDAQQNVRIASVANHQRSIRHDAMVQHQRLANVRIRFTHNVRRPASASLDAAHHRPGPRYHSVLHREALIGIGSDEKTSRQVEIRTGSIHLGKAKVLVKANHNGSHLEIWFEAAVAQI